MSPRDPLCKMIPSRPVCEAAPQEQVGMTVEYTGDVFALPEARRLIASVCNGPAERIEDLRIRDLTSGEPLLVFATGAAGPFLRFRRRMQVALVRFFARIAPKSESGMADPYARPRPD